MMREPGRAPVGLWVVAVILIIVAAVVQLRVILPGRPMAGGIAMAAPASGEQMYGSELGQPGAPPVVELDSPTPPPAEPTPTSSAIPTPSATDTPSATATPTSPPTVTAPPTMPPASPIPTLPSTDIPPTLTLPTLTPTAAPTPTRTTPTATATLSPSSLPYHAALTIGANTREIFQRGLEMGNNPHAFSKVGDSETADGHFMEPFDLGIYSLADYAYLEEVVTYFQGSFSRQSMTAYPAFSAHHVVDPLWANADFCEPGETPLACEYRLHRPSFALILVRSWNPDVYPSALESIIQYSIEQGVVPIVSTCPHQPGGPWAPEGALNPVIRSLAAEYGIPLWDLYATMEPLPDRGVCDPCGDHLTRPPVGGTFGVADFVWPSLQYGATRRNLEGLEILYTMIHEVIGE